jgi:2-C-methyl-D-erythritol 4-phosphate cytidylyltransferase
MNKYAVLVAGGSGKRMGTQLPKQFLLVNGKPVLYYTIQAFIKAFDDIKIILVLPFEHLELGKEIIDGYFDARKIQIVEGGETRFHSVANGLRFITDESIIFVHDGVRCLVTTELIQRCYTTAIETGSAVPVIDCKDSVRFVSDVGNEPLDRTKLKMVQTPQTFHSKILLPAFEIDYKEREDTNIKITNPLDLIIAEKILQTAN